jgi:hypothetical protein
MPRRSLSDDLTGASRALTTVGTTARVDEELWAECTAGDTDQLGQDAVLA